MGNNFFNLCDLNFPIKYPTAIVKGTIKPREAAYPKTMKLKKEINDIPSAKIITKFSFLKSII